MTDKTKLPYCYYCYGFSVHSEIALPELQPWPLENNQPPDIYIKQGCVPEQLQGVDVMHSAGQQIAAQQFLSRIQDIGTFYVTHGKEITFSAQTHELSALRPYLLGTCMAAALYQRSCTLLHASAITLDGKAFLFAAPSGTGKSTTAAALLARGAHLLCDDVCRLRWENGELHVVSAYPILKLRDDSLAKFSSYFAGDAKQAITSKLLSRIEQQEGAREKYQVFTPGIRENFSTDSMPVIAVYILNRGTQPAIHSLNGFAALSALKSVAYRGGIMKGSGQAQDFFDFSRQCATNIPLKQLDTGADMDCHEDFMAMLLTELQNMAER